MVSIPEVSDDRPQDEHDLRSLLAGMSDAETVAARGALVEIETRGFARGRTPVADLARRLAE